MDPILIVLIHVLVFVAGTSLLFLALLRTLAARVGGARVAPSVMRVVFLGALAMGGDRRHRGGVGPLSTM
jgi:vacuolar iron transporter family protein